MRDSLCAHRTGRTAHSPVSSADVALRAPRTSVWQPSRESCDGGARVHPAALRTRAGCTPRGAAGTWRPDARGRHELFDAIGRRRRRTTGPRRPHVLGGRAAAHRGEVLGRADRAAAGRVFEAPRAGGDAARRRPRRPSTDSLGRAPPTLCRGAIADGRSHLGEHSRGGRRGSHAGSALMARDVDRNATS